MAPDQTESPTSDEAMSPRKLAILEAARTAFLSGGYLGTSIDQIAESARTSKQTIYKYFGDKDGLFSGVVLDTIDTYNASYHEAISRIADANGNADEALRELAEQLILGVMHPDLIRLRRLIIGESARFPELGHAYWDHGPGRSVSQLSEVFAGLSRRGRLRVDDPIAAAHDFNWLVLARPVEYAMITGEDAPHTATELRRLGRAGADAFMRAHAA